MKHKLRYEPKNPIAEFTDQFGDVQVIHRPKGASLRVFKGCDTPALVANRAISVLMGQRVKALREARGMSMAELGRKAGLASATPKQYVWGIENASRTQGIRLGTLYLLAAALDAEVSDLLPSAADVFSFADIEKAEIEMFAVNGAAGK